MILFTPDRVGMAVGVSVSDAVPVRRLFLNVDYTLDNYDISGTASGMYKRLGKWVGVAADKYTSPAARDVYRYLGYPGKIFAKGLDMYYGAGSSGRDLGPDFADSLAEAYYAGGTTAEWTKNAMRSLDEIIQPMGLITTCTLDFSESVDEVAGRVQIDSPAAFKMGNASIGGVVFDSECTVDSRMARHGIEPLLEYYYYHRISNDEKKITKTALSFGQTVLKGWVVGLHIEPQDWDFRLWKWSIHLLVDPKYLPKPMKAVTGKGGRVVGQYTNEGYNDAQARARESATGTRVF